MEDSQRMAILQPLPAWLLTSRDVICPLLFVRSHTRASVLAAVGSNIPNSLEGSVIPDPDCVMSRTVSVWQQGLRLSQTHSARDMVPRSAVRKALVAANIIRGPCQILKGMGFR